MIHETINQQAQAWADQLHSMNAEIRKSFLEAASMPDSYPLCEALSKLREQVIKAYTQTISVIYESQTAETVAERFKEY